MDLRLILQLLGQRQRTFLLIAWQATRLQCPCPKSHGTTRRDPSGCYTCRGIVSQGVTFVLEWEQLVPLRLLTANIALINGLDIEWAGSGMLCMSSKNMQGCSGPMAVLDSVFVFVLLCMGSVLFNIYDVFHPITVTILFDV